MPSFSLEAENRIPSVVANATTATSTQITEMIIANNGLVVLRNVRVEKVEGPNFTVVAVWDGVEFVWEVHASTEMYGPHNLGTHFLSHDGDGIYAGSIREGDYITVTGTLDKYTKKNPAVIARVIRSTK